MTTCSGSPARMRVLFMAFVLPREERPKRRASVAVEGFLLGGQFGEGLGDLGEVEQRVIAEAVRAARRAQENPFGFALISGQGVAVAGHGDNADEPASAVFVRNVMQFAQEARVIGFVIGVWRMLGCVALVGRIACGANPWSAAQRTDFQTRVVGDYQLAIGVFAVLLGLLACVGFEGQAIFDDTGQR